MKIIQVLSELFPLTSNNRFAQNTHNFIIKFKNDISLNILPYYKNIKTNEDLKLFKDLPLSNSEVWKTVINDHDLFLIKPKNIYFNFLVKKDINEIIRFSKAVVEFIKKTNHSNLIHLHGYFTGIIPLLLQQSELKYLKTVFTIPNLYQNGDFSIEETRACNRDVFRIFNHIEILNLYELGIKYSDITALCSRRYSEEVKNEEFSGKLAEIFRKMDPKIIGIKNGIKYGEWNPQIDKYIKYNYSKKDINKKVYNKTELQKMFGLKQDESVPLIIFGGKLNYRKGIDLVIQAFNDIEEMPLQLIIYGTGDEKYHIELKNYMDLYENIKIKLEFDKETAHQLIAGADFILLPTRIEPDGVSHLFALKYGTIPIARRIGGLVDVIKERSNSKDNEVNGFLFSSFYENSLIDIMKEAIDVYNSKEIFTKYRENAMQADWSIKQTVKQYEDIYNKLLTK